MMQTTRLADFCKTGTGGTPSRDRAERYFNGGTIPWVKSGELREGIVTTTEEHVTEAALEETNVKLVPAGALLLAMYGATVGRLGILGKPAATNQAVCHIIPDPHRADVRYLFHSLRNCVPILLSRRVGGAQPNISQGIVRELEIPLPPLPEQQRIAAILDQAEALRSKRRQALAKLDTLTQSLFLELFGDPVENPRGWPILPVSSFVQSFQGGKSILSESSDSSDSRNRVLKVSAVTGGVFKPEESKPVPNDYNPPREHFTRRGDLLFSRANTTELVGAVAYVWDTPDNVLLPDKLWRFVWAHPTRTAPLFVMALFQNASFQRKLGKRATGTSGSMKNISQEKVLDLTAILPPLQLQDTFSKAVESLHALVKAQQISEAKLDSLFASLQHRAFRGEL